MKETDYIKATNRVKISLCLTILRDVLPGDDWGGINEEKFAEVCHQLQLMEDKLFASIHTTDG